MVLRLLQEPNASDPELVSRAVDPLLASLREDLSTRSAQGKRLVVPDGAKYMHRLDQVSLQSSTTALATGCKFDDSVLVGPNGETLDDSVSTSNITATLRLDSNTWKIADVRFSNTKTGISECAS
jgi:hypothetical protein